MNLTVRHELRYTYSNPVTLTPHVLHMRPPSNPFVRVDRYELHIDPMPDKIVPISDAEGNFQHYIFHNSLTDHLYLVADMTVTTLLENPFDFIFQPLNGQKLPFTYNENLQQILQPYLQPEGVTTLVEQFARGIAAEANWDTMAFLTLLNERICHGFAYEIRETGAPLLPEHVLIQRRGSCRDYVSLYMCACRIVGLAARFVSGYYFGELKEHQELHAWAEVYLPGGGWRGFDPTQNCAVADSHIPLASSGIPGLVTPVAGTFLHKGGGYTSQLYKSVRVRPVAVLAD